MDAHQIKITKIEPCDDPQYVKPQRLHFERNGKHHIWEVADTHDSVAVLLYHEDKDAFILVRQFRPAVFLNNSDGMTMELCAGLIDKNKSENVIVQEEILEECGYAVPLERIQRLTSFYTAVGFAGGKQTLYFASVDTNMQANEGGGVEGEDIEVIYLSVEKAKDFIFDESIAKTPGLMYAFLWYFEQFK